MAYAKDTLYRRWNTQHGGVYVPVTEDTPPNPYLRDVPERDITTPSGRQLTLLNHAYMIRQVYEMDPNGPEGHLVADRGEQAEILAVAEHAGRRAEPPGGLRDSHERRF